MTATARKIDTNGFLLVTGCPLSSVGIFDYSAGQLGLPGDPNRIVKVFRPESSVSDPAFLASLRDMPLVNDHEMLSGFDGDEESAAPEDYGIDGVLTSNIYYKSPWAYGDVKIFSRSMQSDLRSGKKDLSLGYACKFELKPGMWEGQAYEVVQTNMICNHLALVKEGRVPGARVLDGLCFDHLSFDIKPSDKEPSMSKANQGPKVAPKKVAADSAIGELQALMAKATALIASVAGGEPAPAAEAEPVAEAAAASEPVVEPTAEAPATPAPADTGADPEAAPSAEPEAAPAVSEGGDVNALIAQVKEVLAKLEAVAGGASVEAEPAATDTVEGLQESSSVQGAQVSVDAEGEPGVPVVKDSENPEAGAVAQDAALRNFYADSAAKDSLYQRLSKVTGAFDCRAMDARQVSIYGVKKLGIKCQDGHEMTAIQTFLDGRQAGLKNQTAAVAKVQDHKLAESAELDAYLKGGQ